ncbi:MAG: DMT family transporter, partial [Gammaproteobacteria bacterium]|nr:DMT family transporter [Gammaproteobacteria bacterium]
AEGPGFLLGVLARMSLATILCLLLVAALRLEFPWHRVARRAYFSGALGAYAAMLLIYWAAQYVPSGLISVLFGLSPLVTALLAVPLLNERGITPAHLAGMLVALLGLAVIFNASLGIGSHAATGLAALLAAVLLQSLSLVLIKRHAGSLPSLTVTTGALMIATPAFLATWLIFDRHVPAALPGRALASIVYLGIVGSVIGFTLFFYVLKHVSAHGSALITLMTPVLALLLGAAINHEHVGLRIWIGTALVLGGLALHQWGGILGRWIPARVMR